MQTDNYKKNIIAHRYILIWLAAGLILGSLLMLAEQSRTKLNDPDPAYERPGFLMTFDSAPKITDTLPRNKPTLLLFTRSVDGQQLFHDLAAQADLEQMGDVILITEDGSKPSITEGLTAVIADPEGILADSYNLRQPVDQKYPIGYVVINSAQQIRYRTIDPNFMHLTSELKTIFGAVR